MALSRQERERDIQEMLQKYPELPREIIEAGIDWVEACVDDWSRQIMQYHRAIATSSREDGRERPEPEDMPDWLTEQQKLHRRLRTEQERARLDKVARGPERRR